MERSKNLITETKENMFLIHCILTAAFHDETDCDILEPDEIVNLMKKLGADQDEIEMLGSEFSNFSHKNHWL